MIRSSSILLFLGILTGCTASPPSVSGPITAAEIEPHLPTRVDPPEKLECIKQTALGRASEIGDPQNVPESELWFTKTRGGQISGDTKRTIVANNVVLFAVSTCHSQFKNQP